MNKISKMLSLDDAPALTAEMVKNARPLSELLTNRHTQKSTKPVEKRARVKSLEAV
jgi:hypothetical protein